jgi:hypothetical protein
MGVRRERVIDDGSALPCRYLAGSNEVANQAINLVKAVGG